MIRKMMIFAFVFSLLGCSQHHLVQKSFNHDRIYSLDEFKKLEEPSDISSSVAYLQPGDTIPVKLDLEDEWLGIKPGEVELVAKRKIFFRLAIPKDISRERLERLVNLDERKLMAMSESEKKTLFEGVMLFLSKDAVNWAPLNDGKALKEAFDIKSGTISAGMGMNTTEGLWVALKLATLKK